MADSGLEKQIRIAIIRASSNYLRAETESERLDINTSINILSSALQTDDEGFKRKVYTLAKKISTKTRGESDD